MAGIEPYMGYMKDSGHPAFAFDPLPHHRAMREGLEEGWVHLNLPWECTEGNDPCGRQIGEELAPGFFPPERIAEYKANTRNWTAYWQQSPVDSSDEWFPAAQLKTEPLPESRSLRYFLGIDISVGTSKGDHTALVTVALDENRTLYIADIERFRQSGNYTARRIVELTRKYNYSVCFIDNDTASQQWLGTFQEVCRSTGEGNSYIKQVAMKNRDKEARSQTLRAMLWEDRVRLCPGPMAAHFLLELADFPGCSRGSPDMIDALSCVCNELPKLSGGSVMQDHTRAPEIKGASQQIDGQTFTRATLDEMWSDFEVLSASRRRNVRI